MDLPFMPSQIELWPIERLRPYARNARLHSDNQIAVLAANMVKFGWTMPCLISDDGELIAGHGRIMAATQLGLSKIPVLRCRISMRIIAALCACRTTASQIWRSGMSSIWVWK